ncbi:MAG: response regulator [Desulfuromonadaceae bacterium]|nr:response regulator [Desulfuromonadaceae bacterium]
MADSQNNNNLAAELRRKAEMKVSSHPPAAVTPDCEPSVERLLHELQVHQVELEMQNEELQQTSRELQMLNNSLAEQVADRTKELSEAVARLQKEIDSRKQAEEHTLLLERQFQKAQRLDSLGVLAGGIAHDFNNILAIIMGYCGLTKLDYDTAEKHIPQIEKAVERAAELCRLMLAYAGKTTLTQTRIVMWMLVDQVVLMLKASISQNVEIKTCYLPHTPTIIGDAGQLRQVVMNLLINAAEAIGEAPGVVLVSLGKAVIPPDQSEIDYFGNAIPPDVYLLLEVTDSGCGMDDETMHRIFEPFYTTKFTGRGLGMAAVHGIITAHKGALQLVSHPGEGTTFNIFIPAQSTIAAAEEAMPQAAEKPWKGSGTILLAEDEVQVTVIVKAMLEELGFSVITASNGREAVALYQNNAADISLVVADIGMPIMNGYEMFRELKRLNPELPIIISSGFGDEDVTATLSQAAIAGMLSKPYNFDLLKKVLKSVVGGMVS